MAIQGLPTGKAGAPPEPDPSRSPAPAARGRWLRRVAMALGALVVLVGVAITTLGLILSDLDRPWIKSRVLAYARDDRGLVIDYEGLALTWHGMTARSFRLATPPALAAGAADVVRLDALELRASLWKLALGGRTLDRLSIGSIEVALVADEAGRTTLSELFPAAPQQEPKAAQPLSHSLSDLPGVSLTSLEIDKIAGQFVELFADGSRRSTRLGSLGLRGRVACGEQGLSGTELELVGAPLGVERSDRGSVQHATLGVDLDVKSASATALTIGLNVDLVQQDLLPSWAWRGELLAVASELRFDPVAGKTTISLAPLRALRRDVSLETLTDVFDGEGLHLLTSGQAHIDLAGLPVAIEGVTIDALKLDLATRALSWDGTRVAGAVDASGSLRGVELADAGGGARVSDLTLTAGGAFQPDGGHFQATLKAASVSSRSPASTLNLGDVSLDLGGTTRELTGEQQIDARARLAFAAGHADLAAARVLDVAAANLAVQARGSARDLAARRLPRLEAALALTSLELDEGGASNTIENLTANVAIDQLAFDASAPFGVQGEAALGVTVPALRVLTGPSRARQRPVALALGGLTLKASLPLSLERAQGTLALADLRAGERSLSDLALEFASEAPLDWATEHDAAAHATLSGRLARLDAGGGTRGRLSALQLGLHKLARDRYRLELDATGSALGIRGVALPGNLTLTTRADAAPASGVLKLTGAIGGEGGARVDLGLDAHFEAAGGRLEYSAELLAEKLEAFSGVASEVDARAASVRLEGARLIASAHGDMSGVLHAEPGALPELAPHPLSTARGTQTARMALTGLDYRAADRRLAVPDLAFELTSTHRADAGGNASARLQLRSLEFSGAGSSLHVAALDQKLVATFDRAPDQGVVDVHGSLELGSVAQSWLPGYPVRGLHFSSNVQVDRLRSIYLRELVLNNPASGSALRASGTLELLSQGSSRANVTLVGRQALSFEGRFEQQLRPLERLELTSHASGSLELPFRLESGGLLGYRLLATLEAKQVSFVRKDGSLAVEGLNGSIPVVEEFALLESGPVISAGPRTSPLSDTRFFDVHPFLSADDYVTARSLSLGGLAPLGPIAANVRIERSDFIIDQLQTGYRGGQIVGQVRVAWRDGDPIVRLRLNATGVRSGKSQDVFDANTALTFVPGAMTLDGKTQIVRASREHLEDILDVLDPFHESANANRVRQGLMLGYPKFVRFQLHDGAVDTKVELGGVAQLVRIDEIKAVPLGPILQKYVAPALSTYLQPAAPPAGADAPVESARQDR